MALLALRLAGVNLWRVTPSAGRRMYSQTHGGLDIDAANQELSDVFGDPEHVQQAHSTLLAQQSATAVPPAPSASDAATATSPKPRLTHVDALGKASMVDVSAKAATKRTATASCRVLLGASAYQLVAANRAAKGDVLAVSQLAGIMAAKHTATLIPLCHNIPLSKVAVDLQLQPDHHLVVIRATATTVGATGVEMEALTAASVAALTVYDMCKAVSKEIEITDLRLEAKAGGRSGDWQRVVE